MVTIFSAASYTWSMIPVISRHKQRRTNDVAKHKTADAMHFLVTRNFQTAFALWMHHS